MFTPTVADTYELNIRFVRDSGSYGESTVYMYVDSISVFDPNVVPAPSSIAALIGMGVMGLVAVRRRRKRAESTRTTRSARATPEKFPFVSSATPASIGSWNQ